MDSPVLSQLFRQLFNQRACQQSTRSTVTSLRRPQYHHHHHHHHHHQNGTRHGHGPVYPQQQSRSFLSRRQSNNTKKTSGGNDGSMWTKRDDYPRDIDQQLRTFPLVTAKELRSRRERPRQVKMLTREFIEDSLYNPHYGYFSKHATIFHPGEPFDFNRIEDGPHFHRLLGDRYTEFEDKLDAVNPDNARQLWHTPTELFRPYYGEAIARYLVTNYRLTLYPYHDLIIYEMGAGNGTLMLNILDFIRDSDPEVYQRTKFKVIEISSSLAKVQKQNLFASLNQGGHNSGNHVEIINKSIFEWNEYIHSPCYFLALEVFDNFSHDAIRYDYETEAPQQGGVLIDTDGEFCEYYNTNLDPLAARFLRARQAAARRPFATPLPSSKFTRNLHCSKLLPFGRRDFTLPEYIPTRLMQFFDILRDYFPAHRLLTSDFSSLPDAVPGLNAPVVQTRYNRRTVPVSTPFVHQGYFDIFFPTDFNVVEDLYRAITGKLTFVTNHQEFMERWAYIGDTETKSGENPLLTWYKNAKVLATV